MMNFQLRPLHDALKLLERDIRLCRTASKLAEPGGSIDDDKLVIFRGHIDLVTAQCTALLLIRAKDRMLRTLSLFRRKCSYRELTHLIHCLVLSSTFRIFRVRTIMS